MPLCGTEPQLHPRPGTYVGLRDPQTSLKSRDKRASCLVDEGVAFWSGEREWWRVTELPLSSSPGPWLAAACAGQVPLKTWNSSPVPPPLLCDSEHVISSLPASTSQPIKWASRCPSELMLVRWGPVCEAPRTVPGSKRKLRFGWRSRAGKVDSPHLACPPESPCKAPQNFCRYNLLVYLTDVCSTLCSDSHPIDRHV